MAMLKMAGAICTARFRQSGSWYFVPADGVLMQKKNAVSAVEVAYDLAVRIIERT